MVITLPDYWLPLPFSLFYSINITHSADQPAMCHTVLVESDKMTVFTHNMGSVSSSDLNGSIYHPGYTTHTCWKESLDHAAAC